jgi:signal transduction histidine kinase
MLKQLGAYERYLKQLPKTLRHELHNPLNRLAMSLSLLEKETQHTQLDYAQHAVAQLKQIIASLSEATSIEDSLNLQTPEAFPIGEMLNHYMKNNIDLHPDWNLKFENRVPENTLILGDGFMLEQMLDKLLNNAKDFADGKMPISVRAQLNNQNVKITVENSGQHLPAGHEQQIFDGMTSIRHLNQDEQTHLGLGLYIVKLITDFHRGKAYAENFEEYQGRKLQGVRFIVELPVLKTEN